jgi:hypothetical protein
MYLRSEKQKLYVTELKSELDEGLHADASVDGIHINVELVHGAERVFCYLSEGQYE